MPHGVRRAFSSRGIIALWDWQATLLASVPVVRDHRNALVCLPSGSGKSVAADMLLLRTVLKERRSALLALPYQSAVHEKVQAFEAMVLSADLWVESHDGLSPSPQFSTRPSLYVCTYVLLFYPSPRTLYPLAILR
jgi:replicative superfamily II helicase